MELLKLKTVYCSASDRTDLSKTIETLVAVIVSTFPKDAVILGRVFPQRRIHATEETAVWWLLGYSMQYHMLFAQAVTGTHASHIMSKSTVLRTVKGAVCTYDADLNKACVTTEKLFYELGIESLNDEAVVASFLSLPPERFSVELGYSFYRITKESSGLLPYVSDWVELDIASDVYFIDIPDGIKHVEITTSLSEPLIRLPDSIISCYIHRDVTVQLSIPKRFAKVWGYWSAVWGKPYKLNEGFSCSPDGLVRVRP